MPRPRRGAGRKSTRCSHCGQHLRHHPILKAVAQRYGFNSIAFWSKTRTYHHPQLAFARQVAAYLLRREGHTYLAIGAAMRRSWDMAYYSDRRIANLLLVDARVAALVNQLADSMH